jgi:hypothetical protein
MRPAQKLKRWRFIEMELDHFYDLRKMVAIGSGAKREQRDYELSRYASRQFIQKEHRGDPPFPGSLASYFAPAITQIQHSRLLPLFGSRDDHGIFHFHF